MFAWLLSKIFPPKFPHAADVAKEITVREQREGVDNSVPDCPAQNLGALREWCKGKAVPLVTQR